MNLLRNKKVMVVVLTFSLAFAISFLPIGTARAKSAADQDGAAKPFVAEYYYKAKWGHADEFITLFRNHYPVLRKEIELGRILEVRAVQPRFHSTEDGRWDYRVTIVFKNAAIANGDFDALGIPSRAREVARIDDRGRRWVLPPEFGGCVKVGAGESCRCTSGSTVSL